MESFFITLPSTASSDIYSNTQSHFRVQLPKAIELEGQWKIGLSEIHIPTNFANIDEKTDSFVVYSYEKGSRPELTFIIPNFELRGITPDSCEEVILHIAKALPPNLHSAVSFDVKRIGDSIQFLLEVNASYSVKLSPALMDILGAEVVGSEYVFVPRKMVVFPNKAKFPEQAMRITVTYPIEMKSTPHQLKIPHGLYTKPNHVIQAMVEAIPSSLKTKIQFKNNRNGTVSIICEPNIKLEFPTTNHGLGSLLGFEDMKSSLPSPATGEYPIDLRRGVYGLYVYSDLVQPHVVGDTFAPLLRVIPLQDEDKYSSTYVKIYTSPDYYPIMQNRFETIEIDIRSDFGQRLKFMNGKTLVKLEFRKV